MALNQSTNLVCILGGYTKRVTDLIISHPTSRKQLVIVNKVKRPYTELRGVVFEEVVFEEESSSAIADKSNEVSRLSKGFSLL